MAEETRTEYRVNADGWSPSGPYPLNSAKATAESARRNGLKNVRIEKRTVTETDWEDIADD